MPFPSIFCSTTINQNVANFLVVWDHWQLGDLKLVLFSDLATAMAYHELAGEEAEGPTQSLNLDMPFAQDGPLGPEHL
jgi:hypothetical protein